MIKAIFFDIDGTLIASNGKALASTREASNKPKPMASSAALPPDVVRLT